MALRSVRESVSAVSSAESSRRSTIVPMILISIFIQFLIVSLHCASAAVRRDRRMDASLWCSSMSVATDALPLSVLLTEEREVFVEVVEFETIQ